MVAVIMAVGFRERVTAATVVSIALACGGIACSTKGRRRDAQPRGRRAGLPFGALLCGLDRRRQPLVAQGPSDRETHLLLSGFRLAGLCRSAAGLCRSATRPFAPDGSTPLRWRFSRRSFRWSRWPAIRRIGSTPTAILGALEPVTALFFGVAVFGERFTLRIGTGVLLILVAVTLIIAGKSIRIPTSVTHLARWMARPRLPRWAVRWAACRCRASAVPADGF